MARPYQLLRELLRSRGITSEILAEELDEHVSTISRKLNGHNYWTCDQMWQIMDLINDSRYALHDVFPRNGQNEPTAKRRKVFHRPA